MFRVREGLPSGITCNREKPERGHAAILDGTLFLDRTAALIESIFELAELYK